MDNLEYVIKQLQAANAELKADNDYADFLAEERAILERNMRINEQTFRHAPRVVRDYGNDKVSVVS